MRTRTALAFLTAAAVATASAAQTKQTGTVDCKQEPSQPIEVGDKPNHLMSVAKSTCTWKTALETAGLKAKEGVSVAFSDATGDNFSAHGTHYSTMDNGDKIFVRFQGGGTTKDGKPQSDSGKWSYTGGTGKLKGLKGSGTYKGKPNPDGSMTYQIAGEYTLGK